MSGVPPNKSLKPTALSLAFINLVWLPLILSLASGGG